MKVISFEKVTNEIIEILKIKTLDSYYNMNHPYFFKDKLLVDKLFEKIHSKFQVGYSTRVFRDSEIEGMFFDNKGYNLEYIKSRAKHYDSGKMTEEQKFVIDLEEKVKRVKDLKNQFYATPEELVSTLIEKCGILKEKTPTNTGDNLWGKTTFNFWINDNLNLIKNYDAIKQRDLEISKLKIENSQKKIEELVNLAQNLKHNEQRILEEIEQIEKEVNKSQIRKVDYDNRINENNREIETIESTDGLRNKDPYLKRIQELIKLNSEILKEYQTVENNIASQLKSWKNKLTINDREKQDCEQEIDNEKVKIENMNQELELIKGDKTVFDLDKEKTHLSAIQTVFGFLVIDKEYSESRKKTIQDTFIFYKALKPNISVKFERMNNSINELLNGKLPSKTQNSYLGAYKFQISPLVVSKNDNIIGIIFALKKCFKKENIIRTDNDIYYLNFGNGIVCKFHVRENKDKLPRDIAFLGSEVEPYKDTIIFSGYSNSGYLLNKGLYLITSDLIFEMYFDASPFLVSNSEIQAIVQNISDSNISAAKEKEYLDSLYDDDY